MITKIKLYLAIGEQGSIGDFIVEAIEDPYNSCMNCCLRNVENCKEVFGSCEQEYRPDGRGVIFKEVKK